mmetsp:Transcript_11019/g.19974  ORF Transcript_11019/g.19974 Transcript_11019/m.19974 type:complete len:83 (-) Transcript_11019:282-530(-)
MALDFMFLFSRNSYMNNLSNNNGKFLFHHADGLCTFALVPSLHAEMKSGCHIDSQQYCFNNFSVATCSANSQDVFITTQLVN